MPRSAQVPKQKETSEHVPKKKRRSRYGMKARREIKKYSKSTNLLLKHAPFRRIVLDRIMDHYQKMTGKECIPGKDFRFAKWKTEKPALKNLDIVCSIAEKHNNN